MSDSDSSTLAANLRKLFFSLVIYLALALLVSSACFFFMTPTLENFGAALVTPVFLFPSLVLFFSIFIFSENLTAANWGYLLPWVLILGACAYVAFWGGEEGKGSKDMSGYSVANLAITGAVTYVVMYLRKRYELLVTARKFEGEGSEE